MTRLSQMARFAEPTAADDRATCQGCDREFYYETLTDEGLCPNCTPEKEGGEES